MFSIFNNPVPFIVADKVWMTESETLKVPATQALKAITQVVSFFEELKSRRMEFFSNEGVPFVDGNERVTLGERVKEKSIFRVNASGEEWLLPNTLLKTQKFLFLSA